MIGGAGLLMALTGLAGANIKADFLMPVGFLLVALQGISELIKRVAFLNGVPVESLEAHYERPTQ